MTNELSLDHENHIQPTEAIIVIAVRKQTLPAMIRAASLLLDQNGGLDMIVKWQNSGCFREYLGLDNENFSLFRI